MSKRIPHPGAGMLAALVVLGFASQGPARAADHAPAAAERAMAKAPDSYDLRPLTNVPGDPKRGRTIVMGGANCLACHDIPIPEAADKGDIGPSLAGVGDRLTVGELRQRLVNPKVINPDTIMPAYYVTAGLYRVSKDRVGKPGLTAQEIEDVVAYLHSLKDEGGKK